MSSLADAPHAVRPAWFGASLVAAGALLLSTKGIFAKLLYAQGVDVTTLVTVRSLLALVAFWAWGLWRLGSTALLRVDRQALLLSLAVGLVCYYGGAMLDFYALTLIDAGLERVLLFSYPALVVLAHAWLRRAWPGMRVIIALALTYAGIVLAVGLFDAALWRANRLGAGLVLLCAISLALYFLANEKVSRRIGSIAFTVYAMTAACAGLAVHWLLLVSPGDLALSAEAWWMLAFMAVFVTVVPLFMMAEGVKIVGAQRASIISTVGPPSTILLAALILGESMQGLQLLGVVFTVAGIVVLELRRDIQA